MSTVQSGHTRLTLEEIVRESFHTEVNALKPGNVHRFSRGHGMNRDDFLLSAQLVTPILCDSKLSMGQRILNSVKITREKVGINTNLGMLLLFVPIIIAAQNMHDKSVVAMQYILQEQLKCSDKADAKLIFQAIRKANPGGLGHSTNFDVWSKPDCGLLEAMAVASERDSIARQYTNGFQDVFDTGLGVIKDYTARWNSVEWATVACYLTYLATTPDSHVARKHGSGIAEQVRQKAIIIAAQFKKNDNPVDALDALLEFDRDLKENHINPGTSADLAAAGILVYRLINS